jgi:hypothetical protein
MHSNGLKELRGFDLLSLLAQQRLRARITDASGDIAAIRNEISAQIDELDRDMADASEANQRQLQADRAFFVAQLTYLDLLAAAATSQEQPRERGFLARLRGLVGRA